MPYLLGALFCLFPLMVYSLLLAGLNQRRQATLVPGGWDFAGVLLALSGFLILGGPAALSALQAGARGWLIRPDAGRLFAPVWLVPAIWAGYALAVLGGSALLVWGRRNSTAVYNVDPAYLEDALPRALEGLGLSWTRQGQRFLVEDRRPPLGPDAPARRREAVVEVEPSPALWHATLFWHAPDPLLRREVEAALDRELAAVVAEPNPLSGWLLGASAFCFVLILMLLLFVVVNLAGRG